MANSLGAIDWEDLRKQARHLENEIDAKLVAFSKLGINAGGARHVNVDEVPLLDEDHVFENMTMEIETLLSKLFSINERMSELQPNGAAMLHTMQRHKEILKDYKLEFNKIRNNFAARKDREDLLGSVRKEIDNYKSGGLNRREMYLKENQHIHNSDRLINDQISIAMETRDHLITQRQAFKRIRTRLNDISNRFPAVNSLLQRINLRKRRDSVILGLVIGVCTFLMLLYAFH